MIRNKDEITALISLLDDPDTSVHYPVIDRLIQIGAPAVKILEHTWESANDNSVQKRIENIVLQIQQGMLRKDLKDWTDCRGDQLLYGAYLIARSQYPELQFSQLEEKIDPIKNEIWLEFNEHLTALEKVKVINHFLFSVHKFNRSVRGVQSPPLYLINHVLDTQKGLPISLAIVYAEIAARLEIPIYCVDLPQNFLLCYHDPTYLDDPDGILFYINPYTQGTVLGRAEVEFFLDEQKIEKKPEYMQPSSNIETIQRLTEGLRFAYAASRMNEKASFLQELTAIMQKGKSDYLS
jgi:regulator of sirC expression with transglutaminase-like and TPR domain